MLRSDATAYDAARAMDAHHVGAVVVIEDGALSGIVTDRDLALRAGPLLGQEKLPLKAVMSPSPATIEIFALPEEAAALMIARGVRRLVVVKAGVPRGIVTFDDLIMAGTPGLEMLAKIVRAQLKEASRLRRGSDSPRARGHRAGTQQRFASKLMSVTGLERAEALDAFEVFASNLMRRLTANEAKQFASQLPGAVRERLLPPGWKPDKRISRSAIEREVAEKLQLDASRATEVVWQLGQHLDELVSPGEVDDLAAQMPANLKRLFHRAA